MARTRRATRTNLEGVRCRAASRWPAAVRWPAAITTCGRARLQSVGPALFLLLTLGPAGVHGATPGAPPTAAPIETFMQIGAATGPVLSPDGGELFFTSAMSGANQLYRLLPDGWPYQLTFFTAGLDFSAFNRDCTSAVVGADEQGNEQYQLFLLDARTGAIRPLTDDRKVRYGSPTWSRDGPRLYYTANDVDPSSFYVYETGLDSLRPRLLLSLKGSTSINDVSPVADKLIVSNTTTSEDNNLYLLDAATGRTELITPHHGERNYWGGVFSSDGAQVYCVSDDNPDSLFRLCRIDLATRKSQTILTGDPRWEVETFNLSDDRRFLAWVVNEDGYGRLHLHDLRDDRSLPVPEVDGIVSAPVPVDGGFLAYAFNSPTSTSDVWVWDFRAAARLPVASAHWRGRGDNPTQASFSSYAGIDPEIFHPPSLVRYRSFDGREIPAFLYLPPGERHGPIPFIVEAHGGPAGQFRPYFIRHFQYLMQNGFGILAPNFRGSSGYGRDFKDADNYRRRLDSVKDVAAGARWLIDQGYTRLGQIGIKGASYGGYMTLAAMTEFPDLFAAGIDQVGIADFQSFLQGTAEYRRSLRESEYGPLSDGEFLRSISPLYKADRIQGALFVVHGANDPRVPVGEARQILRAVQAHGTPVDSLIFPDEGHGIAKRQNQLVFYRKAVEFLRKYLAG